MVGVTTFWLNSRTVTAKTCFKAAWDSGIILRIRQLKTVFRISIIGNREEQKDADSFVTFISNEKACQ